MSQPPKDQYARPIHSRGGMSATAVRQIILFIILAVLGGAAIYDYLIARPQFQAAWERVLEIDDEATETHTTSADVRQMIGRDPSETHLEPNAFIEVYRWRRGIPIWSYELSVVYFRSQSDDPLSYYFYTAAQNQPLEDLERPAALPELHIIAEEDIPPLAISAGGGAPAPSRPQREEDEDEQETDPQGTDSEQVDAVPGPPPGDQPDPQDPAPDQPQPQPQPEQPQPDQPQQDPPGQREEGREPERVPPPPPADAPDAPQGDAPQQDDPPNRY